METRASIAHRENAGRVDALKEKKKKKHVRARTRARSSCEDTRERIAERVETVSR